MPTLNIGGRRVKVDDSFLSLTPEQQNETVDEIAQSLGASNQPSTVDTMLSGMDNPVYGPGQAAPAPQKAQAEYGSGLGENALTEGSHAGAFFGFDDELSAGFNAPFHAAADWYKGEGFDIPKAYNKLQQQGDQHKAARREAAPVQSLAGEVLGGMGSGGTLGSQGVSLAGRNVPLLSHAAPRTAGVLTAAGEGAAYGGLYGAGEAKPGERLSGAAKGAAIGAATGGALEMAGQGVSRVMAGRNAPPPIPADELAAQSRALYQAADQAGVVVQPQSFGRVAANVQAAAGRINRDLRPNTAGIVDDVLAMQGRPISLQELDELRQVVGQSMQRAQPQDVRTLTHIRNVLDNFADNARPGDITGDVRGFDYIRQARELWARRSKTETINNIIERARNQATGFENGLVINMRALANNRAEMRRFTPGEQRMIRDVVRRGSVRGIMRAVGMLSPNSTFGGLMAGGVGVGAGLVPGAILAGTGMAARSAAGAMTRGRVNDVVRAVSTGQLPPNPALLPNHARQFIGAGSAASTAIPRLLEPSQARR